ncbi:MAG: tripartite tricarboxylate transporter substrate binding protein, partial [Rhodobacteraceae bacterium]|nr:tripartite tricarboxylate transporter substrate binding protein [Paracoccaceae bacterium]
MPLAKLILIHFIFLCSLYGEYPSKPITVIVPFAAGGGSDVFVRIFQNAIRKNNLCPQPIVIKNIAGAGGTIGSRSAKNATPDGHTILCLHDGIYTAQHYGNADWGPDNFEPIAATGRSGVVVAVEEDSPYASLNELMEEAKDRPYQLVYGTNLGAPNHYSALFLQNGKSGAKFRFTQTGGGAKRLAQLKGGHIDLTGFSVAEYQQFKDAGIKALASLGEERESSFPNLTTALEQEVRATHDLMQFWWAPQNTPPERIAYLQNLLAEAMATREIKESFQNLHMDPVLQVGQDLLKTIADRSQKLQGITIDKPTALPPLEWIILGITVICFVFVLRESKSA